MMAFFLKRCLRLFTIPFFPLLTTTKVAISLEKVGRLSFFLTIIDFKIDCDLKLMDIYEFITHVPS